MRVRFVWTLGLSVGLWAAACGSSDDDETSDEGTQDGGSGSDGGSDSGGGDDGGDDGGTGSGGGGSGTDGGACVPLGDLCFDDYMGNEEAFEQPCCDDGFCDVPMCTDSEPPHCMSFCACVGDGQECLQITDGTTVTDKPCCAGLACTGCQDTDKGEACVCRPG